MQTLIHEADHYKYLAKYLPMPKTILDVGAAEGSVWLYFHETGVFPTARHVFIDCMVENEPLFQKIGQAFGTDYIIGAAGETKEPAQLRIDRSPYLTQRNDHTITGMQAIESRTVPGFRLDQIVRQRAYQAPFFLRLDVQGAEAMVLAGADGLVNDTPLITVEISFYTPPETTRNIWLWLDKHQYEPYALVNFDHGALCRRMTTMYLIAVKRGILPNNPHLLSNLAATAQQESAAQVIDILTEAARRLKEAMA
jgi:FkbM family methyltransferase